MEIKKCCLFNKTEEEFKDNKDFSVIKKYGEISAPNECTRSLLKCNKCGALFLYQFLEWNDSYYNDYIQVENAEQADKLNEELDFSKFSSNNPMIKIGSDKKVVFQVSKDNSRARKIIDALSNKDQDKLKELNVSNEEIESVLRSIDKKLEKLDKEEQKYNSREKQIIDALSNKDQDRLKELNVSNEEIESILKSIDRKLEKLNSEILEFIYNVEKEINYTFVEDYKNHLLKHTSLKPEKNILGLANGTEKLVRYFYSVDPNSKTYILKFQNFDSELKDKLVPFAELEFGDTLCFERETNKIVIYNHETDTIDVVANDWNNFIKELYDDYVYKTKNGFEYKYKGLRVIITADEVKEELTNYADQIIEYYFENKDKVINHLFEKFRKDEWYVKDHTEEEIIEKIGKPTIYVDEINWGEITYLNNELDEHLITIELYGLELSHVTIDG